MWVTINPSTIEGEVRAPPSKSHTIRALVAATLAHGQSIIHDPLVSRDTQAAIEACRLLGAQIECRSQRITIEGCAGRPQPIATTINVANSGTTLRLCAAVAALSKTPMTFTGDYQTLRRPMAPLLQSLEYLGATCQSRNGYPPIKVQGPLRGGRTTIDCETSQYLSALLLTAPLAPHDTQIIVTRLNEKPYVRMTLEWLARLRAVYQHNDLRSFTIMGGQQYRGFDYTAAGDWSSATFLLCAAAICRSKIRVLNLSTQDSQGDRKVIDILMALGYAVDVEENAITLDATNPQFPKSAELAFDLNNIPDVLPALVATACFGPHPLRLYNIAHVRIKESDRIQCMKEELQKMGGIIKDTKDEITITPPAVMRGAVLEGHHDHRIVMALSIAALGAEGPSSINNAEDVDITFPHFFRVLSQLIHRSITPYE